MLRNDPDAMAVLIQAHFNPYEFISSQIHDVPGPGGFPMLDPGDAVQASG